MQAQKPQNNRRQNLTTESMILLRTSVGAGESGRENTARAGHASNLQVRMRAMLTTFEGHPLNSMSD
ncbi:hypothetical protein ABT382_26420 [Streptomyces pharetrae]|uniref:hypothetical protein n=1 Tax=Streptomyces pharetrae TaxID=291370 RepID=UPI00334F3ECA